MRRSRGQNGSFPSLKDGTFPCPEEATHFPEKEVPNASKLTCALRALKCSSRATEEDNYPTNFSVDHTSVETPIELQGEVEPQHLSASLELDRELSLAINNHAQALPVLRNYEEFEANFPELPPPNENTDTQAENPASLDIVAEGDDTALLGIAGETTIDHTPFEDHEDEDVFHDDEEWDDDHEYWNPQRMSSDDTQETPNTSNRNPNRPATADARAFRDAEFDAYCQRHYNTPRVVHTQTSLGDSITPLGSPADDMEEPDQTTRDAVATTLLQLPTMCISQRSHTDASYDSVLHGEAIVEEKKTADEHDSPQRISRLHHDPASVQLDAQQVQEGTQLPNGAQEANPAAPKPLRQPGYESLRNEESSFSSVSSFTEAAEQRALLVQRLSSQAIYRHNSGTSKKLTPFPFFWRSHPGVTVSTIDMQQGVVGGNKTTPHIDTSPAIHSSRSRGAHAVSPASRFSRGGSPRENSGTQTYLHPSMVRKMWVESKPLDLHVNTNWRAKSHSNRHPQGPPSARSGALLQTLSSFATNKLPSVFTRREST